MTTADVIATAQTLNDARATAGLSLADVHLRVVERLSFYCPRAETLRTYHSPKEVPQKLDLTVLIALADVYGMTLSDLPYEAPKDLHDLLFRASRCTVRSAAQAAA